VSEHREGLTFDLPSGRVDFDRVPDENFPDWRWGGVRVVIARNGEPPISFYLNPEEASELETWL
jgi:hypothetical protein